MPGGRPRKSPTERALEGNPGKRPIPVDVFTPAGAPFVPEHLPEDAQACAEQIIGCFPTKHLSAADSYMLAAFAAAWAWHKAAVHAMSSPDFKPVFDGPTGQEVVSPWFRILNEQARVMATIGAKLYLTPADRAKIGGSADDQPQSKFGKLIAIKGGRSKS